MDRAQAEAIVADAQKFVGRETSEVSDPVSLRQIKEFLAGTDDWDVHYFDEAAVRAGPYHGVIAPPLFFGAPLRQVVAESELLEDGQYRTLGVPGVEGRSMSGGWEVELFEPVRVGDVITARIRIKDIYLKEGRSGSMVFQIVEFSYSNQKQQPLAVLTETFIFR